ncbi:hypothetical protein MUK42_06991 [Musa troglodytarum]|uniref:Uncharacterized protein n=1 Tax=Musa troglodytarum TaxID=320322 RepID=A0A9E7H2B9_9LILI|nr:hypothetical protein MUK42_06991 [Musa troglodytarum]URE26189.1 hypothetical protein MUK42_06991 [Musa troglodytarum]
MRANTLFTSRRFYLLICHCRSRVSDTRAQIYLPVLPFSLSLVGVRFASSGKHRRCESPPPLDRPRSQKREQE